jgi:hypothetical protein
MNHDCCMQTRGTWIIQIAILTNTTMCRQSPGHSSSADPVMRMRTGVSLSQLQARRTQKPLLQRMQKQWLSLSTHADA